MYKSIQIKCLLWTYLQYIYFKTLKDASLILLRINIAKIGGIPYTAHGAQITPSTIIFDYCKFFCFYAYFRLG